MKVWGARDSAVVTALASHQCGPGSNTGVDAICGLSLLLVLSFAPRGFSPGTPVFPSPQKPTFQISIRSGIRQTKSHFVDVLYHSPTMSNFIVLCLGTRFLPGWFVYMVSTQGLAPIYSVTFSLGHLHSRDSSIQGTQNLVVEKHSHNLHNLCMQNFY